MFRPLPTVFVLGLISLLVACPPPDRGGDDDDAGGSTALWVQTTYPSGDGEPSSVDHSFLKLNRSYSCSAYQNWFDDYASSYDQLYADTAELEQSVANGDIDEAEYSLQYCILYRDYYEVMGSSMGALGQAGAETTSITLDHPDAPVSGEPIAGTYVIEGDDSGEDQAFPGDDDDDDDSWDDDDDDSAADDDDDGPSTSPVVPTFWGNFSRQTGPNYYQAYADTVDCEAADWDGEMGDEPYYNYESGLITGGELEVTASGASGWTLTLSGGELTMYDEEMGDEQQQALALDDTFPLCEVTYPEMLWGL